MIDESILMPIKETGGNEQLATVMEISDDGLRLQLDGENRPGEKYYKKLAGYVPAVGDRVYFMRINGTYLVIGKVG